MSNIQNKIGRSIFKLQESIDKGKSKVDLLKETSQLNKQVEDLSQKKLEMIIKLGMTTHKKIREGHIDDTELNDIYKSIVGFDYIIYETKNKIKDMILENEGIPCECGNRINEDFKFCNQCGKKVEQIKTNINLRQCNNCEMDIDDTAKFCPCCGVILN